MVEDSRTLSCLDSDEVKALAVCLVDTSRSAYVVAEHKFQKRPGIELEQDLVNLGRIKQCATCKYWKLVSDFNPPAGFVCGDCVDAGDTQEIEAMKGGDEDAEEANRSPAAEAATGGGDEHDAE